LQLQAFIIFDRCELAMAARKASHAGSWYTESSKFDPLFREVTLAYFCFILMWHPKWSMALIMSSDLLNLSIYAFQHKRHLFWCRCWKPCFCIEK